MLNKKWHTDRVKRCKQWVKQQEYDIAFAERQLAFWQTEAERYKEQMKERETWLTEAEKDLQEYIDTHKK